jgi:hypothetical protein
VVRWVEHDSCHEPGSTCSRAEELGGRSGVLGFRMILKHGSRAAVSCPACAHGSFPVAERAIGEELGGRRGVLGLRMILKHGSRAAVARSFCANHTFPLAVHAVAATSNPRLLLNVAEPRRTRPFGVQGRADAVTFFASPSCALDTFLLPMIAHSSPLNRAEPGLTLLLTSLVADALFMTDKHPSALAHATRGASGRRNSSSFFT